jgi:serine/threonine-protein kinase
MASATQPAKSPPDAAIEAIDHDADVLPRALGRYRLLSMLARGGMGEVYLASTSGLEGAERPVVVKVIRREHASDPSFFARFLDEARVQAQLQHSGVAQVIEAAIQESSGEPYVVVEYVEGRSLGEVRARARETGAQLGWAFATAAALSIAEALAHVHERVDAGGRPLAIVHRDLSPQNVMVAFAGELKLIDFGTARGLNRKCHTVAGVVFAKPGYVAPEVANGDSGDARVDLYALGVMLWELCAGRRFLQGDAAAHLAAVSGNELSPPALATSVGAPPELDLIIAKLTAFDRDERYATAHTVAADLAKVLAAAPALASGERGVRARITHTMRALFPGEPMRQRRDFAKRMIAARALRRPEPQAPLAREAAASTRDEALLAGTRYRILRELGRGESGAVYEAEHVDLGRRVALKVLATAHVGSEPHMARFRREARALSHLSDPSLVKLIDFGVAEGGRLYSVNELCDGETLATYLAREKTSSWRDALLFATKVLRVLSVVHEAGIVHRDVKPANLLIEASGRIRILDFGLAKTDLDDDAVDSGASVTVFGTPEYMAPEQAARGRVDGRADLYALGCVLYEMLTGRLPFAEASELAILDAKTKGSPETLRERAPSRAIPRSVDALVMRALARHPSVRFQSAAEMLLAIERALAEPERRRQRGRLLGMCGLTAAMAFAAVLLGGKATALRELVPHSMLPERVAALLVARAPERAAPPTLDSEPPPPMVATALVASPSEMASQVSMLTPAHADAAFCTTEIEATEAAPTSVDEPTASSEPTPPAHPRPAKRGRARAERSPTKTEGRAPSAGTKPKSSKPSSAATKARKKPARTASQPSK